MWGNVGKGVVNILALALVATTSVVTTAGAEETDEVASTYYIVDSYGHPVEPYAELPNEVQQGIPGTNVELQQAPLPIQCEAIAALYEPSVLVDGVITIVSEGKYKNPTKAWAWNPPGNLPSKSEVSTFPNGPRAFAHCPTNRNGIAEATFGGYKSDQFSVRFTSSETTSVKVPGEDVIVAETTNLAQGIKAGDLQIGTAFSWLKVEFRPGAEPKVSYRLELTGVHDGKALSGASKDGIVLAGENLSGGDWIEQFNEGAKSYASTFEALATYGFRVLEPRFTRDQRSAADRGGSVYPYYYELSAVDGVLRPTARRDQTGHGFGMRVAVSRIAGTFDYFQ